MGTDPLLSQPEPHLCPLGLGSSSQPRGRHKGRRRLESWGRGGECGLLRALGAGLLTRTRTNCLLNLSEFQMPVIFLFFNNKIMQSSEFLVVIRAQFEQGPLNDRLGGASSLEGSYQPGLQLSALAARQRRRRMDDQVRKSTMCDT